MESRYELKGYMAFCDQWLAAWTEIGQTTFYHFILRMLIIKTPSISTGLRVHQEILVYFTKLLAKNPDWRWEREEIFVSEKVLSLNGEHPYWKDHLRAGYCGSH